MKKIKPKKTVYYVRTYKNGKLSRDHFQTTNKKKAIMMQKQFVGSVIEEVHPTSSTSIDSQ